MAFSVYIAKQTRRPFHLGYFDRIPNSMENLSAIISRLLVPIFTNICTYQERRAVSVHANFLYIRIDRVENINNYFVIWFEILSPFCLWDWRLIGMVVGMAPIWNQRHYPDAIMSLMASQITSLTIVYSPVYSGTDQRKHPRSASQAFVGGIQRWPVNSPHKRPVKRKMFPFDDVILLMKCRCNNTVLNKQ